MAGVSGFVFGNTKAEVKEKAKKWYYTGDKEGLYPRNSKNDFAKDHDFKKDNIEFILVYTQEVPIQIVPLSEFIKHNRSFLELYKEDITKYKYAAFVTVHS